MATIARGVENALRDVLAGYCNNDLEWQNNSSNVDRFAFIECNINKHNTFVPMFLLEKFGGSYFMNHDAMVSKLDFKHEIDASYRTFTQLVKALKVNPKDGLVHCKSCDMYVGYGLILNKHLECVAVFGRTAHDGGTAFGEAAFDDRVLLVTHDWLFKGDDQFAKNFRKSVIEWLTNTRLVKVVVQKNIEIINTVGPITFRNKFDDNCRLYISNAYR